ncbi:MAG: TonB C-terminal domain-containing protein [Nitrospira sp.]|nr:TonB C-terminal domain-containing protein [Nitrospira sp.]MCP9474119.1 TonB C-terminal domain-containing protein [Nitrospira sp.]
MTRPMFRSITNITNMVTAGTLMISLLGIFSGGVAGPADVLASASGSLPSSPLPAVTFDFGGVDGSEDIRLDKPLELSFMLNGTVKGRVPMVAVLDSLHFERQVVPLEPDPLSKKLRGTAVLDPIPPGKLSAAPRFARIRVTFARAHSDNRLERVLTRIVYVTLDACDTTNGGAVPSSASADTDEPSEEDPSGDDAAQVGIPVADGSLAEEDVFLPPPPGQHQVYWDQISSLISRSWSRTARRVRAAQTDETVRVRFRMYPNGRAQLIEIEKGSGARDVDEAGIHAVIHAQPFPPFPDELGSEPVTVHVRMKMGAARRARGIQSITHSQPSRLGAPTPVPSP